MGLFDRFKKSECGICGKEVGALGKRKIDEGYICKECADKLSPFYTGRKKSSLEEIRAQLDYREANKESVAAFQVSRTLGIDDKVMIDDAAGTFVVVSSGSGWRERNPDVIPLSQVTGAQIDVDESRSEETYEDKEGKKQSYDPPRYTYRFETDVIINLNNPWFDQITVDVDSGSSSSPYSMEKDNAQRAAQEICDALTAERDRMYDAAEAARAPKTAMTCPHCGATCVPDEQGRCEYCGGSMIA